MHAYQMFRIVLILVYVAFTPPETVNSPAKADVAIATEEITENNSFVNLFIVSPLLKR